MVTRVDKFLGGLGIDATDKFEVQSNATVTVGNGTSTGNVHVGGRVSIGNTPASSIPLYVKGDSVGISAGDQSIITTLRADATNQNFVEVSATREAAGSAWNDAGVRLQQKVDTSYMGYIQFNGDNNDRGISFGTGVNASATGVAERMRIVGTNGRVGIGTETPSSELEVNGTITATAFSGDGSSLTGVNPTTHLAVGTYAMLMYYTTSGTAITAGSTISGSSLRHSATPSSHSFTNSASDNTAYTQPAFFSTSSTGGSTEGTACSGTWRLMGMNVPGRTTFLRIDNTGESPVSTTYYTWFFGLFVRTA